MSARYAQMHVPIVVPPEWRGQRRRAGPWRHALLDHFYPHGLGNLEQRDLGHDVRGLDGDLSFCGWQMGHCVR
eukprot:2692839-Pyramimonas_sp.AAC.1